MKKNYTLTLTLALCLSTAALLAQTKRIKVYFTQPVDNSYSTTGVNAIQSTLVFDTLAAYINRAQKTIDICQYEYKTWPGDPIYTAINNAYSRGVKIRYIQDGSYASQNTGVAALNASIPVTASPTGSPYGICHNKFVIIDVNAHDTSTSYVWTGSPDWDQTMQQGDYNNIIVFQSRQLAQAYTHEFNIMWGDTTHGGAFNATNSLFGPHKPNSGKHQFNIGGTLVELYFSPSDTVNNHLISTINSATLDMYCGMFTFTETTNANDIVSKSSAGVYTAAILDHYSSGSYTPYTSIFPTGLGSNFAGYVASNTLYHNKYLIVNPSATICDDPKVLTGSHNWTSGANSKNDENTVIVHNDTIANVYLQAFAKDFETIGTHSLSMIANPCSTTGIASIKSNQAYAVYPNPTKDNLNIAIQNGSGALKMAMYNVVGQLVKKVEASDTHEVTINMQDMAQGIYYLQISQGGKIYTQKVVKE
ncbi:MAG: T9SS type A sorting domain-containing protein [Bacteroidetes bacterium]|nr:T9SS type A sorting domain-containing protein [Bacteroidota bacterium]